MMETGLLGWADLVMETIQIVALGAILWRLKHLHREITALVRVVRRMDRKTPEKKTGAFLTGAGAEGAGMRLTGE
jgi:hypothetical protein